MEDSKVKYSVVEPADIDLRRLVFNSAATIVGYMPEELHLYMDFIKEFLKEDPVVAVYTSDFLNSVMGTNLQEGINMFSIDLSYMKDVPKFSVTKRFEIGFRWLDDIVDNNLEEQEWN